MKSSVNVYDDALPRYVRSELYEFLINQDWKFGAYSTSETNFFRYWYKHFGGFFVGNEKLDPSTFEAELPVEVGRFWDELKQGPCKNHTLMRCYANAYPYGSEGAVHTDIGEVAAWGRYFTALYYPHLRWDVDWGGETLFFNDARDDLVAAVYPKPGRLIVFDSKIPHVARPLSRKCPELRITLMFKTEIKTGVE